jgi:threonine efflux protein
MELPTSTLPALGTLALLHILAAATPGPNFIVVGHRAAAVSRASGLLAVAGVTLATLFWVVLSLAGVSALLQQAGELYHWLRLIGAGYLLYAGGRYLLSAARPTDGKRLAVAHGQRAPFLAGLLTTLSNPKSGVFWTSVFALAVPPAAPAAFYLAAVVVVMMQTVLWYGLVALIFASAPSRRVYARLARWLEAIAGTALLAFGLRLAVEAAEPPR